MRIWIQIVLIILTITPLASQGQTPTLVKDICPGNCNSYWFDPFKNQPIFAEINGQIIFYAAAGPTFNMEPHITDGTETGTVILKEIYPGTGSSLSLKKEDRVFMPFNGLLYFAARDSIHGQELWTTDGTSSGTSMLIDFNIGTGFGAVGNYDHRIINNTLIYPCEDALGNRLCFISSGTPNPVSVSVDRQTQLVFGNNLAYFAAEVAGITYLWTTDGTVAGTVNTGISANIQDMLFYYNGYAYYTVFDTAYNIYRSNGTIAGTNLVANGANPAFLQTVKGGFQRFHIGWKNRILMNVQSLSSQNYELYISDGTEQGTQLLKEINPTSLFPSASNRDKMSSYPAWFCEYRDRVYFAAQSSEFDRELWVTNGTEAGTVRVLDIFPGDSGSDPAEIQTIGSGLMFVATDSIHGRELWVSDGTAAGTRCLDLRPGPESSNIRNIYNTGTELYFFALLDTAIGTELYKMPLPVVDTTVSVSEIDLTSKIQVWPNPATESIKVQVLQTGYEYISKVNLIDLQGRVVISQRMAPNTFEAVINVSALNSGIYFIEVTDAIGQTSKHKVVVAR